MIAINASHVDVLPWYALTPAEQDAVLGLQIDAQQAEFAGAVSKSVAACEAADPAVVVGLAIRFDCVVVGWVVLKRGPSAPEWVGAGAAVVSGLRIDIHHQGLGIGSAALAAMAHWISRHWPDSTLLKLRVDDGNAAGIRAYEKAGWVESGERLLGRVGVERTMSLRLANTP